MKLNILYCIVLTNLLVTKAFAQNIDSLSIINAKEVVKECFNDSLKSEKYLLYKVKDNYIVIVERPNEYRQYFIKKGSCIEDSIMIKKNDRIMKKAFDVNAYDSTFINIKSDSIYQYYNIHSEFIYFVIKEKDVKYGEFNLPVIFNNKPKDKDIYPIDKKVHEYLMKQIITHWKL